MPKIKIRKFTSAKWTINWDWDIFISSIESSNALRVYTLSLYALRLHTRSSHSHARRVNLSPQNWSHGRTRKKFIRSNHNEIFKHNLITATQINGGNNNNSKNRNQQRGGRRWRSWKIESNIVSSFEHKFYIRATSSHNWTIHRLCLCAFLCFFFLVTHTHSYSAALVRL